MQVMFASISVPRPKISMSDGNKLVFENGVLHLDDANPRHKKYIDELRESIETRPAIRQLIREVNREHAEEIARKHMEQLRSMSTAIGGALSSAHLSQHKLATELAHLANNPDPKIAETIAAAIQTGELTPTVSGDGQIVRSQDGFISLDKKSETETKPGGLALAK